MDYEYWLRLGRAGVFFEFLEARLAGSRMYADNKTLGSRVKVHKEIAKMFKDRFGSVPDKWLFGCAKAVVGSKLDRDKAPISYNIFVGLMTVFYSIFWNRTISASLVKRIIGWIFRH
jgi:hypothetical protein